MQFPHTKSFTVGPECLALTSISTYAIEKSPSLLYVAMRICIVLLLYMNKNQGNKNLKMVLAIFDLLAGQQLVVFIPETWIYCLIITHLVTGSFLLISYWYLICTDIILVREVKRIFLLVTFNQSLALSFHNDFYVHLTGSRVYCIYVTYLLE